MKYNKQSVAYRNEELNNKNNLNKKLKLIRSKPVKVLGIAPFKAIMLLIVIISMISYLIYSKIELDKVGSEIIKYKSAYEDAVSESVRLEVDMESKISLKNIENWARKEGLGPAQDYQIEYIDFKINDNIEINNHHNQIIKKISDFFSNLVNKLKKIK